MWLWLRYVALAMWLWLCGFGYVALAMWLWLCGFGYVALAMSRDEVTITAVSCLTHDNYYLVLLMILGFQGIQVLGLYQYDVHGLK